jgi:hypothetical protein
MSVPSIEPDGHAIRLLLSANTIPGVLSATRKLTRGRALPPSATRYEAHIRYVVIPR